MKLTKQIGKNVLVCMLALTSMTSMVFASGSSEISTSSAITGDSWAGVIDGIAIDLEYNQSSNAIEGTITNLLQTNVSNATVNVESALGETITSLTLGLPGSYELDDVVVKANTTILSGGATVPVMLYLTGSQAEDILNNGWKISFDSDNAPKYGLFENGEVLAKGAVHISDSIVFNENGFQTVVSYTHEDYIVSGSVTNYTNKEVASLETEIYLSNGTVLSFSGTNVQPGQTVSMSFGVEDESGFTMYAAETIIK